jgi:hypothetical protein
MSFCLGEHVDFQLKSQGKRSLHELNQIAGFRDYLVEQIGTEEFINNEIRRDMARGNHLFSIVWLLLADYFYYEEYAFRSSPTAEPEVDTKVSHKILSQWSYTLWATEGQGNPDKLDEIVKFCGKVSHDQPLSRRSQHWPATSVIYHNGDEVVLQPGYKGSRG